MKLHIYPGLRSILLSALALMPAAHVYAQGDFIRQKQLDELGIIRDYYVSADEGEEPSILPISLQGAEFSLYAKGIGSDEKTYFLDSKVVGAYLPSAEITIVSEDPHVPPRTRADRPYKVSLTASGMVTDETAPDHQTSVYFRRVYEEYDRETHSSPQNIDTEQVEVETFYMKNGSLERTQLTALPVGSDNDPTKVEGEEVFTIFSTPDSVIPAYSVLDSEVIKVWPVADGEIVGIEEGQRVIRSVPQIRGVVRDVYPSSLTYLQIYTGPQADGTAGVVIVESEIGYNTTVPQEYNSVLESWDHYCAEDGIYTLELVTVTPFNGGAPEILDTVTFEVDRTIKVRANVISSE